MLDEDVAPLWTTQISDKARRLALCRLGQRDGVHDRLMSVLGKSIHYAHTLIGACIGCLHDAERCLIPSDIQERDADVFRTR